MAQLTLKQKTKIVLLTPIVKAMLMLVWSTCRVQRILGEENLSDILSGERTFLPCYWHQNHVFGAWYMRKLLRKGRKIGFLVSPSRDGEIPARIIRSWGATVIRGSTTRAGAQAMRDMYEIIVKQGVSPVTTSDGPQGPLHKFKLGDVLLSQFTRAPLVPFSYAAERAWRLSSWDQFVIPKPFSRIAIAIGRPCLIPRGQSPEELEETRQQMEDELNLLGRQANDALMRPD